MALTTRGRNREFRRLARRYLNELSGATRAFTPPDSDAWYTDYAMGFAGGHVGLAAGLTQHRYAFSWFSKWPRDEDILPVVQELIPECLGLNRDRFIDSYGRADDSRKQADGYHPMNLGVGFGHTVPCVIEARTSVRRNYFGVRIMDMELELRKLRAPTLFGRLTGYRPFRLVYCYMVMRTLGETVFGMTTDQATHFAQNYRQPEENGTDAKPS